MNTRRARPLALLVVLVAFAAFAGERWLGNTEATDGGSANNHWTARPFDIGSGLLLTVQCDQDSFVMVNIPMVDAGTALKLAAGNVMPTSCSQGGTVYTRQTWNGAVDAGGGATRDGGWRDAGVWTDCLATSKGVSGSSVCHWYTRQGNEGP